MGQVLVLAALVPLAIGLPRGIFVSSYGALMGLLHPLDSSRKWLKRTVILLLVLAFGAFLAGVILAAVGGAFVIVGLCLGISLLALFLSGWVGDWITRQRVEE